MLYLASSSPYRKALLERLKIPFLAIKPPYDEDAAKNQAPPEPVAYAEFLALGKAQSLVDDLQFKKINQFIVIGGDQLVSFNQKILGKPGTADKAIKQLLDMQGQWHELITSTCLIRLSDSEIKKSNIEVSMWTNTTKLLMRKLSSQEIEKYVQIEMPVDCAGSYKIESAGINLFEKIESSDWNAIQGLPLIELCTRLKNWGITI